jgi:probable rRNA maturation factor
VLSVVLVDATEMAELNLKYREKKGPTNVLSFCQNEGELLAGSGDLLGDVVICADVAADDAAKLDYSEDEMVLYVLIHGILHLLGHHHDLPGDDTAMQVRVESIFQELVPAAGPE